jgi:prephenate dehydrogenase
MKDRNGVLIVGGSGEFGKFLQQSILPLLGIESVLAVDRESTREEKTSALQKARHLVLATPLAGYAELACDLVHRCRAQETRTTFWFIPSVQAGVWRAVTASLESIRNPLLSAIFVHPMYGPNGFRATDAEASTFQNILTAKYEGSHHSLSREIDWISKALQDRFNITTTVAFNPDEHDRFTAYSQGLSYCIGQLMFERSELDRLLRERLPELHYSFHANHDLILDFLRINSYVPEVMAVFANAWRQTSQETFADLLSAFGKADLILNGNQGSSIPTKWYERLRAAAGVRLLESP